MKKHVPLKATVCFSVYNGSFLLKERPVGLKPKSTYVTIWKAKHYKSVLSAFLFKQNFQQEKTDTNIKYGTPLINILQIKSKNNGYSYFSDQALSSGLHVHALQKSPRRTSRPLFFLTFRYPSSRHPAHLPLSPPAIHSPPSQRLMARNRKYYLHPPPSQKR